MTVYRPKNSPYYHFDFQFRGNRFHGSTGCASKRDAERYERDRRAEAALGVKEKPSVTVDEGFGYFWSDRGQFDKTNATEYQLEKLSDLLGRATLLHDLDDLDISRFIARRRGEKVRNGESLVSNATVNREVELLKRAIRFLAGRYKVPKIDWRQHKLKEPKGRVRSASFDEQAAILAAAREEDDDLADLIEFALLSGARRNAVVTLLWSKVDLQRRWAEVRTKGDVWHGFPLTARMIAIIANRPKVGPFVFTYVCRKTRRELVDKKGRKHRARVKGQRYPFSREGWVRHWYRIRKAAGVDDFRFHDFRHTAGTEITRSSNLKAAQMLLGHTRIETTARYAHVETDDLLAAMENVDQSRNSPEQGSGQVPENRRNARGSA